MYSGRRYVLSSKATPMAVAVTSVQVMKHRSSVFSVARTYDEIELW